MNTAWNDSTNTVQQAFDLARVGQLQRASELCSEVLEQDSEHAQAWLLRAVIAVQAGNLVEAAAAARRSIQSDSTRGAAYALLGDALLMMGQTREALDSYDAALRRGANLVSAHIGRGNALLDLKRPGEAVASYEDALRFQPDDAEVLCNRGNALFELGEWSDSIESYSRAIAVRPDYAVALNNRGCALLSLGKPETALASFDAALAVMPSFPQALYYRAAALRLMGAREEALQSLDLALQSKRGYVEALVMRGEVLLEVKRPTEALASFDEALRLDGNVAATFNSRGNGLLALGRPAEAVLAYDESLRLDPNNAAVHANRAHALAQDESRIEEALAGYARALQLDPDRAYAAGAVFHAQSARADWTVTVPEASRERIVASVLAGKPVCAPFAFLSVTDDAAAQLACASGFARHQGHIDPPPKPSRRHGHPRIRVAYVSADLREHAVTYLLTGSLERHDRQRFEVYGVSLGPREASLAGERVRKSFDRFIDAGQSSDREIAQLLQSLEVDIAVDLTGYTKGSRPQIFAHGAAPIQVNYLGYPGTTGAPFTDYLIADDFVIPPGKQHHYSEAIVYLPHCFQANDHQRPIAQRSLSRAAAGLPENSFVFCCFNNTHKINSSMFDSWMRMLTRVPASVLWLLGDASDAGANLRREAANRGVDAGRLVFAPRLDYAEHLDRLKLADLFLDTLPFNAGATASDALWAGTPVLTQAGDAFAARMAGSLLRAAGLPELITESAADYEGKASELAQSPEKIRGLRHRLAENRATTPLFDTDRFTRHLEAAYTGMWARYESGRGPSGFAVEVA